MKTLHYRRHSIKDGPSNTIGPKGLELARREGEAAEEQMEDTMYDYLFHGVLARTIQTGLAFCTGLGYVPPLGLAIPEIGSDELFAKIATPEWRIAAKVLSNFHATLKVHGEKAMEWAKVALKGVRKMFACINDGTSAVAFGHSPIIELAAFALATEEGNVMNPEYTVLGDMEGLTFVMDNDGKLSVEGKISVQKEEAKA